MTAPIGFRNTGPERFGTRPIEAGSGGRASRCRIRIAVGRTGQYTEPRAAYQPRYCPTLP